MTTFETAQVGDRVWCLYYNKWFTIANIRKEDAYPIKTEINSYTLDGRLNTHSIRMLFWDEVIIIPPEKPLPKLEVDTKVLVWDDPNEEPTRGYFSHFEKNGNIVIFSGGGTSWSKFNADVPTVLWQHWELVRD